MEWTEQHDNCLCQEILVLEPFKANKGSIARGQIWDKIANNLNSLEHPQFRVTKRSVRERYTLLSDKFRAKIRDEEKASGIDTDLSEVEKALEEIAEKEAVVEETTQSDKKKVDSAIKAAEMRNRALENLGGTQKRQRKDEVENETEERAKRRRSGGDTVAYLREKNNLMQKWKMEEMQLQKQRLEAESKKEEQSKKQHQDLMQVMLQQTKQQQERMQNFQQMFILMQQQQSQIIIKLLEKQN